LEDIRHSGEQVGHMAGRLREAAAILSGPDCRLFGPSLGGVLDPDNEAAQSPTSDRTRAWLKAA
jgi:hypothetical protein